jgi:hypothetical protein
LPSADRSRSPRPSRSPGRRSREVSVAEVNNLGRTGRRAGRHSAIEGHSRPLRVLYGQRRALAAIPLDPQHHAHREALVRQGSVDPAAARTIAGSTEHAIDDPTPADRARYEVLARIRRTSAADATELRARRGKRIDHPRDEGPSTGIAPRGSRTDVDRHAYRPTGTRWP